MKNFRFKTGERDHIRIIGEDEEGDQIVACGVCEEKWPPEDGFQGRARFAYMHWMKEHVKCKST